MGRYSTAHADPQGPGDARPTALQIIHDENLEGKLAGKVIVLTGATSGIGLETSRALAITGATLYLTARDIELAATALKDILDGDRISLIHMDNASLGSVRQAAATILARSHDKVNILINNAGVFGLQTRQLTEDGHEVHFAVNYLSHFLLFQLLKPALLASSTAIFRSRVVNVSSSGHRIVIKLPDSNNYNFEQNLEGYHFNLAYCNSKLAMIYMCAEIDRRHATQGLRATSLNPGFVITNISRHIGEEFFSTLLSDEKVRKLSKSPVQAAATTIVGAVGKEWEDKGGLYLEDCEEARRGEDDGHVLGVGYVKQTYDPADEKRLYEDSLTIVGIKDENAQETVH